MNENFPDRSFQDLINSRLDCGVDSMARVVAAMDTEWITPSNIIYSLHQMKHVANYCETVSRMFLIGSNLFKGNPLNTALGPLKVQIARNAQEIAAIAAIQQHVRAWKSRN